jgi:hypothetical protein
MFINNIRASNGRQESCCSGCYWVKLVVIVDSIIIKCQRIVVMDYVRTRKPNALYVFSGFLQVSEIQKDVTCGRYAVDEKVL